MPSLDFQKPDPIDVPKSAATTFDARSEIFRYFGVRVAHDYGLGIIYSAVLSGWTWVVVEGILEVLGRTPSVPTTTAVVVFAASYVHYWVIDHKMSRLRELPARFDELTHEEETLGR